MFVWGIARSFQIHHDLFPAFEISWYYWHLWCFRSDFPKSNASFASVDKGINILLHCLPVALSFEKVESLLSTAMSSSNAYVKGPYQPGSPRFTLSHFPGGNIRNPYHIFTRVVTLHTDLEETIFQSFVLIAKSFCLPQTLDVIV